MKKPFAIAASLTGATGAILGAVLLSAGQSAVESVSPSVPLEQKSAFADQIITSDEYAAAYEGLAGCVKDAGIQITEPEINPIDGISFLFTVDVAEVGIEKGEIAFADCRDRYWSATAAVYQSTAEPRMDPAVHDLAQRCLSAQGFAVDKAARTPFEMNGGATISTARGDDTPRWEAVSNCLYEAVAEAHPDMKLAQVPLR